MKKEKTKLVILGGIVVIAVFIFLLVRPWIFSNSTNAAEFNEDRAYQDVVAQTNLGVRAPGTEGHRAAQDYFRAELEKAGWTVRLQNFKSLGHKGTNIIAERDSEGPWVLLGAHYDTRLIADNDPLLENQSLPVMGANDGASGAAVLLELARTLPANLGKHITLVFFDLEDQGNMAGWDWILGSRAFAESLVAYPNKVVIVDMIGDKDLNIYQERNSDSELNRQIWESAASLDYSQQFIQESKYGMLDDHTPFLEKGIPSADLIDFDYSYWHTTGDTLDKVSSRSLGVVGRTLLNWLLKVGRAVPRIILLKKSWGHHNGSSAKLAIKDNFNQTFGRIRIDYYWLTCS